MKLIGLILFVIINYGSLLAQWTLVGSGMDSGVRSLQYDSVHSRVYAFGAFEFAGGVLSNGTAYWEGGTWHSMGQGVHYSLLDNVTSSILVGGDSVMISGFFRYVEGLPDSRNTVLWDGSGWRSIGPDGTHGIAWGLLSNEDGITIAGRIDSVAGMAVKHMARFQNGIWNEICAYPSNEAFVSYQSIAHFQGQYIFGGNINVPGIREIGYLDGDTLKQLGTGIGGDSWVNVMKEYQGKLYIGGEFYANTINPGAGVLTWNGDTYNYPFPGIEYTTQVKNLDVRNGELYISGICRLSGSSDFYNLARYNGEQICLFGKNLNMTINAMVATETELFVAPNMPTLGLNGDTVNYLAKYDLNHPPDTCIQLQTSVNEQIRSQLKWSFAPNPFIDEFRIQSPNGIPPGCSLELVDMTGKIMFKTKLMQAEPNEPVSVKLASFDAMVLVATILDNVGFPLVRATLLSSGQ